MDLSADVMQIQVEPEYPVQEIHSTETYFVNERRVQILNEVRSTDMTVSEFLAQVETLRVVERNRLNGSDEKEQSVNGVGQGGRDHSRHVETDHASLERDTGEDQRNTVVEVIRPSSPTGLVSGVNFFKIFFPKNGSVLDVMDRQVVESLPLNKCFRVAGYASPEGDAWYNYKLSLERAEKVSETIVATGRTVIAVGGLGRFSSDIWPHPWPIERRVEIYAEECARK